ncbi:MAG: NAD(P)H-hydrate dehydratase [Deltaproteobacteria bacterium]|nr:NAD(P)H-hydrate dehydratase [Deltaproteobacteria bacterium]
MFIVTSHQMREMDSQTINTFGLPGRLLMENAGKGAAAFFTETFPHCAGQRVGIVAGKGNNGGDGFVIARYLSRNYRTTIFLLAQETDVKGDAATNLALVKQLGIPIVEMPDTQSFLKEKDRLHRQDVWIDAIFGTGLKSHVKGHFKNIISFLNHSDKSVFSVDIASGIDADTGQVCGICINACATATFAFPKVGHLIFPGAEFTGRLKVIDIGIPTPIVKRVRPDLHVLTPDLARAGLSIRPPDAHKGQTGHLLIVAGSPGKTGAGAMTAVSALRTGAGLVTLGIGSALNPIIEANVIEAMTCPLPDKGTGVLGEVAMGDILNELTGKQCLAIGPGLGTADETIALVRSVLGKCRIPVVIDADGLNALAGSPDLLKRLDIPVVLTPHPGEMARLTGMSSKSIQQNRVECARRFAIDYHCHLVLKGAGTVVAHPDGQVYLNLTGNAGMATGGMGDVLTGIIAGLIAQGASAQAAAVAGVYLHGAAGDAGATSTGPQGFLAREVMDGIPRQIKLLLDDTLPRFVIECDDTLNPHKAGSRPEAGGP